MKESEWLEMAGKLIPGTLMETLDMRVEQVDAESVVLSMPVGPAVHQPFGLLHGGASAALAESAGSLLSALNIDPSSERLLGISLQCNHLRSVRDGRVHAEARFIHRGRSTHLVAIDIRDAGSELISSCRLTNILLPLVRRPGDEAVQPVSSRSEIEGHDEDASQSPGAA